MRASGSQPVEHPANHEKPDGQEKAIDKVARAYDGAKGFTDHAQGTGRDAQSGDPFRKNAPEHDEREDQDTDRGQDADSIGTVVLRIWLLPSTPMFIVRC